METKDPNSYYILDELDGEIYGLCGYYVNNQELYLQTTIFLSFNKNDGFIGNVLNYLLKTYPQYTINIGIEAENDFLGNELKKFAFKLIDDLYSASAKLRSYNHKNDTDIQKVYLSQWKDYKEIHEKYFAENYWNYDRIKENFASWIIYSIKENDLIKAYIFIKSSDSSETCEIFGIYGDDFDRRLRLIEYSLLSIKDKELIYYFIEDYDEMKACKKLGFEIHGHYQAWKFK